MLPRIEPVASCNPPFSALPFTLHLVADETHAFRNFPYWIFAFLEFNGPEPLKAIAEDSFEELRHVAISFPHDDPVTRRILVLEMDNTHVRLQLAVSLGGIDTNGDHVPGVQRSENVRMSFHCRKHILGRLIREFAIRKVVVVNTEREAALARCAVDLIQQLALGRAGNRLHAKQTNALGQRLYLGAFREMSAIPRNQVNSACPQLFACWRKGLKLRLWQHILRMGQFNSTQAQLTATLNESLYIERAERVRSKPQSELRMPIKGERHIACGKHPQKLPSVPQTRSGPRI